MQVKAMVTTTFTTVESPPVLGRSAHSARWSDGHLLHQTLDYYLLSTHKLNASWI